MKDKKSILILGDDYQACCKRAAELNIPLSKIAILATTDAHVIDTCIKRIDFQSILTLTSFYNLENAQEVLNRLCAELPTGRNCYELTRNTRRDLDA